MQMLSVRSLGACLLCAALLLSACESRLTNSLNPITQSDIANSTQSSLPLFRTSEFPSPKSVPGAQIVNIPPAQAMRIYQTNKSKNEAAGTSVTTAPSVLTVTMYSPAQKMPNTAGSPLYNLRIDYSNGESVFAYMADENTLFIRNSDGSSGEWNFQFTLGADSNVYLTAEMVDWVAAAPAPTPLPTTSPSPKATINPCLGTKCPHVIDGLSPDSTGCTAFVAAASILGAIGRRQTTEEMTAVAGR